MGIFQGPNRDLTPPQCHLSPRKLFKTLPLRVLFRYNDGKEPPFFRPSNPTGVREDD